MTEQHVAVLLLDGVHTTKEALGLEHAVTIGGIKCRALRTIVGEV